MSIALLNNLKSIKLSNYHQLDNLAVRIRRLLNRNILITLLEKNGDEYTLLICSYDRIVLKSISEDVCLTGIFSCDEDNIFYNIERKKYS